MKSINEYINESLTLVIESFQSSIINDINNSINDKVKAQNEHNKKVKAEAEATGDKYYSWKLKNDYSPFRKVIKDIRIEWSKVKDSDFEEYNEEDAITQLKRMASNRSTHFNGLAIPVWEDEDGKDEYRSLLYTSYWGDLYYFSLISAYGKYYGKNTSLKPKDVEDYVSRCKKVYILNLTKRKDLSTDDKKASRAQAQSGIVYNTENYYKTVAENNRERYAKLAAQLKQKKYADDGISEKVERYVNKGLEFVKTFSKDPIKYAKYEYDIKNLVEASAKLLSNYSNYMGSKLSSASGRAYSWDRDNFGKMKEVISTSCKNIDTMIEKIEDKLSA